MKRRSLLGAAAVIAAPRLALSQRARPLKFVPHVDLAVPDPLGSRALVTRNHALLMGDTLFGRDQNLQPQYQMLEGATVEDDGKAWRLVLRPDLRFHDNEPVLAKDAVASLRRWAAGDISGESLFAATDELSAPDDRTILFRLKRPFPRLPHVLSKLSVMAPVIIPERLANAGGRSSEVIGSGPFRFKADEYMAGARAVYERFSGYVPRGSGAPSLTAGPKIAKLDRIEWYTMPEPAAAASALQAGEMDWLDEALPDLLASLRRSREIVVGQTDFSGTMSCLYINHLHPPFDNPAIRRAVLSALDQSDFMTAIMGADRSLWRGDVGIFCPGTPLANDAGIATITGPRDLAKAKRDIEAAGYRGEKVVMLQPGDIPSLSTIAEVGADLLKRLGMNVDMQTSDWATVLQRRIRQVPPEQGGWSITSNSAPGIATEDPSVHLWMRGNGRAAPIGWMTSPRMEALRDEWFATDDIDRAKQIARQIQLQAWQDVPYLPTGQHLAQTAYRRNIDRQIKELPVFWGVEKR
jgi:peptide/nickel transport system substrate-binding protein